MRRKNKNIFKFKIKDVINVHTKKKAETPKQLNALQSQSFGKFNLSGISNEDIISFSNKLLTEERNGQRLARKPFRTFFQE